MRNVFNFALAPIALMIVASLSLSAAATTLSQAQQLCAKNPNCYNGGVNHGKWMACVSPSAGPKSCVTCPAKGGGKCTASRTVGGGGGSVVDILTPSGGKVSTEPSGANQKK
jgi:hypothetical protein